MLDQLITRATLKNLAGATAFARGEDYFSAHLVSLLRDTDDKVSVQEQHRDLMLI
ncbi:MAG: hypothetical protein ACU841_12980 [Gammaproteobacteria bacterium]